MEDEADQWAVRPEAHGASSNFSKFALRTTRCFLNISNNAASSMVVQSSVNKRLFIEKPVSISTVLYC